MMTVTDDVRAPSADESAARAAVAALEADVRRLTALLSDDQRLADAVIEQCPFGILVCDADGRFLRQNPAATAIWAGRATPGSVAEWGVYRAFHTDGRPFAAEDWAMAQVLAERRPLPPREVHIQRFDGTHATLVASSAPLLAADGAFAGALTVFVDVTRLRVDEDASGLPSRRLALRYAVTSVLAEADSVAAALPRLVEEIAASLGWAFGAQWLVDETGAALRCGTVWTADAAAFRAFERATREHRYPRGVGLPGRVWAESRPIWVPDPVSEPGFTRAADAAAHELRAAFAFPVTHLGELVCVLEFFTTASQAPDAELLATLDSVGSQIGQFIARHRALEAVAFSEALTASVVGAALDCVITSDAEGRVIEFNPAAERTFGYRRAEVLGQDMADLIVPPQHRAAHRAGMARWLVTGEGAILGRRIEITAVRKGGEEFPIEIAVLPLDVPGARFATAYLRDITARRRADEHQRLLAEAAERLAASIDYEKTLAEVARLAVPTLADWCIIELPAMGNFAAWREVVHHDAAKAAVASQLQARYPESRRSRRGVEQVMATGKALHVPVVDDALMDRYHTDPVQRELIAALEVRSVMLMPLKIGADVVGTMSLVSSRPGRVYDHDDLAVAEELARRASVAIETSRLFTERERLVRALERTNADLSQFAYVASHDLRAPLRGIGNLAAWIEEDLDPVMTPDTRRQLGLMRGRVERMEGLIDGMLRYARAGHEGEPPEEVDVAALLAEAIELLAPPSGATVEVGDMPTLTTQRVPLQQVLMNLVGNALKYAKREDAVVRVTARDAGAAWEFAVSDNGPGIPEQHQDRIWAIFHKLGATSDKESSGIGLAVVKKLVEQRDGRVWVTSAPGEGATFTFTWPKR
ncbi:MAG: PAS domain S-box protein [Myxococcales bacterium]|nr:PAS domain S-box protein [Myxococcales bacterium]MCB9735126.1 PAS domain S-box protein [Deltaproteobacteria bacterium]